MGLRETVLCCRSLLAITGLCFLLNPEQKKINFQKKKQVKTALEMESHEEKLHNMIRQVFFSSLLGLF
jgi:hypothetical protein